MRDERVIKSSEVNARRETLSDVGDRPTALLLVLLQPPPVAITHRTPNTIQSSKPHVRDPIPTRSQLFGSFKARSLAPGVKRRRNYEEKGKLIAHIVVGDGPVWSVIILYGLTSRTNPR